MKYLNIKHIVLTTLFSTVFSVMSLYASKRPPAPFTGGLDDGTRVGGAIDDFLPLLFVASIVLGVWALNKFKEPETTA